METQKGWRKLNSWPEHLCPVPPPTVLKKKWHKMVMYQPQPQPQPQHRNQARISQLWNNFLILQNQQGRLNPSESWYVARIYLRWAAKLLMHLWSLKLSKDRREQHMSNLITSHWDKYGWIQRNIHRKLRLKEACTLKVIGLLKWSTGLENSESRKIQNSTTESRQFFLNTSTNGGQV